MVVFLWLILPFTVKGEPLFIIGPLAVVRQGVMYAAQITVKSNAIMLVLLALIASTPVFTLGQAMHALKMPRKMVHLFFFTFRYIHVIYSEYLSMINAIKIRGFIPGTNLHTYKTYAYLVGMLLVRSSDRAQRVYNAMLCRGFNNNLYSITSLKFSKKDLLALLLMLFVTVLIGMLEWTEMVL